MTETVLPQGPPAPPMSADGILQALDDEQRTVATLQQGPVCVLAGAGTGKTRAITHRIAYGVLSGIHQPQHVLAVTFTARAAGQMRTRLRHLGVPGVQARTFHAAALRQLSYFWPRAIGGALPPLIEHKAALVADAALRLRLTVDRAAIRDLAAEIEWAKVTLLTPQTYPAEARRSGRGDPAGLDSATVARLLEVYEEVKTERNVIDFEDVLLLAVGILGEYPQIARTIRSQYRTFVVDEYQDVNTLQQQLLDLWIGDRQDICVVGDPSQTIYSFTGASPEHLLGFSQRYPRAQVVRLVRDYRSTPQVVGLANTLLTRGGRSAIRHRVELLAQRPSGPEPVLQVLDDDVAEAEETVRRIRALSRTGVSLREIAVLYRTNAQSQPVEAALTEAQIPYQIRGGERFFSRKEVRDAIMLLRGAARAGQGGGDLPTQAGDVLSTAGWTSRPPSASGAVRERWESLHALMSLAEDMARTRPSATLSDLVEELQERADSQHAPTVEGVTLASFHSAKGLEWDAVVLIGLSEGLLPISFAQDVTAVEEERRLLYVGFTRAREHLYLSWARARAPGGHPIRNPSRFLDGLFGGAGTTVRDARKDSAREPLVYRVATCRRCERPLTTAAERKVGRCSRCPATYDQGLWDRLCHWRAGIARSASVPAYAVLTDATLTAVAEIRPQDRSALTGIPGVGRAKADKYGSDLLELLGEKNGLWTCGPSL
ncbi:MAG: ATP-dependent helicase UvrD/PcrA [Actinomycetota bacterium]|nr:ATP-dependent helicase UvrD/PcrA [Actinomycetota bacterium]